MRSTEVWLGFMFCIVILRKKMLELTPNCNYWKVFFSCLLHFFGFLSIFESLVRILNSVLIAGCCPIRWCVENPEVACSASMMKLCDFVENYEQN